jgi:superfamily II DNA or RNA helicase
LPDTVTYPVGSLVTARGREWLVLPESRQPELLILRPLGATDDEITGILPELEPVTSATFAPPDPATAGDASSARLLRDALRLGIRSSAGPFRSFGRIAVDPRPYQLVPLLMALKLEPVRLLIADDVGIGKTIEAALIAREMLDRGDAQRLAVLCPPHLAEQWQLELWTKFHLHAELVLPSTVKRLERGLPVGRSLFEENPHVIVSTDFIKSDRRRQDFVRACPELVIVDEAHTFAFGATARGRHQRHELLQALGSDEHRHLILVTATPHSGKDDAFRSLLALLDPSLADLPEDLSGATREGDRRRLARHLVQRRRVDIGAYLDEQTPFPDRLSRDVTYELSNDMRAVLDDALEWARDIVRDEEQDRRRQRVRWWSALALLRSVGSSPAAAAATLRTRAENLTAQTVEEADELGRLAVMDDAGDEGPESLDSAPGALDEDDDTGATAERKRLLTLAKAAENLAGAADTKLQAAIKLVKELVRDGNQPIVFCRFIPTAEYVAEHLRSALGKNIEVAAITGTLAPSDRESRLAALCTHDQRVLVATDCLSEGINLQDGFDAVIHYDLAWNPTRHEQREGRVDRFGQERDTVRAVTFYASNSPIDGIVLEVLLRKHERIRIQLGVSVPMPADAGKVADAILEGVVARGRDDLSFTEQLSLFAEVSKEHEQELHKEWDAASERERRTNTVYAQHAIHTDEVARELAAARDAIGDVASVERFASAAITANGGRTRHAPAGGLIADISEVPAALRDAIGEAARGDTLEIVATGGALSLNRSHPVVQALAAHVVDTALDSHGSSTAARCGVLRTRAVATRTTLLLIRTRIHLTVTQRDRGPRELLAEDAILAAFTGTPDDPFWLSDGQTAALLDADPDGNVAHDVAVRQLERARDAIPSIEPYLDELAHRRAGAVLDAHRRVRASAKAQGSYEVRPQLPVDVLGLYVYLPVAEA